METKTPEQYQQEQSAHLASKDRDEMIECAFHNLTAVQHEFMVGINTNTDENNSLCFGDSEQNERA